MLEDKQITIRMPKDSLAKWLTALRSGKYQQGFNFLKTEDDKFCCLGVLQQCLTGEVEAPFNSESTDPSAGLPSVKWLDQYKITFLTENGNDQRDSSTAQPYLPLLVTEASSANDGAETCHEDSEGNVVRTGVYSFSQIADAIEDCAEGF